MTAPRPCAWCATTFTPGHRQTIYCRKTCAVAAANERRRHTAPPRPTTATIPRWDDIVRAECWCGAHTVGVHLEQVRRLQTGTCGQPHCTPKVVGR